jgi:hypothetical protein
MELISPSSESVFKPGGGIAEVMRDPALVNTYTIGFDGAG